MSTASINVTGKRVNFGDGQGLQEVLKKQLNLYPL